MNLPDFLAEWPFGEIMLHGHRISLHHVVSLHRAGYSASQIREQFPTLSLELVEKVLSFYRQNQAEVDAYVDLEQRDIGHQRAAASPRFDPEELRHRYEAMKRQETV